METGSEMKKENPEHAKQAIYFKDTEIASLKKEKTLRKAKQVISFQNGVKEKAEKNKDGSKKKSPLIFPDMPERKEDSGKKDKAVSSPIHFEQKAVDRKDSTISQQPPVIAETAKIQKGKEEDAGRGMQKNYDIKAVLVKNCKDRNGDIVYEKCSILVQITIFLSRGVVKKKFTIPWKDIGDITKIVSKKFPYAILYDKKAAADVENSFRETIAETVHKDCYIEHGWQMIGRRHVYLHRNVRNITGEVLTEMELPIDSRIGVDQCFAIWGNSVKMYRQPGIMMVLSAYSFLGVTYRLFDEANFAPRFLLFLAGKTGSFKTAISKLLYTQTELEKYRKYPRRLDSDTEASLERGIVLGGRDTTVLIDDFSPAQNKVKKISMENKLEMIVRMVGDRSSKGRSNTNLEDCRGEGVNGMVVLTGELRGKGLSSNLRCLYCELEKGDVDVEAVTWMQENEVSYTTLIQHFIDYLSQNWDRVVAYIKDHYNPMRKEACRILSEYRFIDSLVTLWMMADIMQDFFESYCLAGTRAKIIAEMKTEMISVLQANERQSVDDEPAVTYMRAIASMIENKRLPIKDGKMTEADMTAYDGYIQDGYLYLLPDISYQKITGWIRMGGARFSLSMKEVAAALCREGYAVQSRNGTGKKTNYSRIEVYRGQKINFLKIRGDSLKAISENGHANKNEEEK